MLGEVTSLKHELGDDTVEAGALVPKALLAGAESAEVLGRLGDVLGVEVEVDDALTAGVLDLEVGLRRHGGCDVIVWLLECFVVRRKTERKKVESWQSF